MYGAREVRACSRTVTHAETRCSLKTCAMFQRVNPRGFIELGVLTDPERDHKFSHKKFSHMLIQLFVFSFLDS